MLSEEIGTLVLWAVVGWLGLVFAHHAWHNARLLGRTPGSPDVTVIPLTGGCAGAAACVLAPWPELASFGWVPLLLDFGAAPYMAIALFAGSAPGGRTAGVPQSAPARAAAGSLVGTAVGDALGLACEGLSATRQARLFPSLDGHAFLGGRGMCSDDTEHACMTAQALLGAGRDERAFARMLGFKLRWWLAGLPAGIGLATLRSIVKLWVGFPPQTSGVRSAGNGPAMRAPIIGVRHAADRRTMAAIVRASSRITHTDPRALDGALAVGLAASMAATGTSPVRPEDYLAELETLLDARSETLAAVRAAANSVARGETPEAFAATIGCARGVSGYVLHTVPVVIHVWLGQQTDFAAAIRRVIRLGGDTDTTAAILGGIVGASVGVEGIPVAWRSTLAEWPRSVRYIEALGARVGETGAGGVAEPELPLFVPAVPVRNLFFMAVVLLHGFRRLLPPY